MRYLGSRTSLIVAGVVVVLLLASLFLTRGRLQWTDPRRARATPSQTTAEGAAGQATPLMPTPPPGQELEAAPPSDAAGATAQPALLWTPVPPPAVTPPPGGQAYFLTPAATGVGWASNRDTTPNQFGDYNIYAGIFDGRIHIGAMQFDLSQVPPGAQITYADLMLTGLSDEWLGEGGTWTVELLGPWMDQDWANKTYADLSWDYAPVGKIAALTADDLGAGRANTLVLGPAALKELQARVFSGFVSLRISGPGGTANNLFTWDSGYGTASHGRGPVLRIVAGPAPLTPAPSPTPNYVIVTSTPAPANVVTVAAMMAANPPTPTVAASGVVTGTATPTPTPLPPLWVTPVVVEPTATPGNAATAAFQVALATAEALVTGTPTPLPPNVWTATPTATFVVVTLTPTAASPGQAVARAAAEATHWANEGTPTPFPPNVVTATPNFVVVTATPRPPSQRAAVERAAAATASALLYGTATPTPRNWVTPTPLPLLVPEIDLPFTPTPVAASDTIPDFLRGRIVFLSDRLARTGSFPGQYGGAELFVMDPDGSNLFLLTQAYPYVEAQRREATAPDGQRRVIVQSAPNDPGSPPQLYLDDPSYGQLRSLVAMKGYTYDPAWSPVGDRIAFVSTEPGNDEIFTVSPDGADLQRLTNNTWEWDKHPSWSPDGRQIVFYSNRDSGRRQIWIMDANGANQRNLSNTSSNDWDPIWIK